MNEEVNLENGGNQEVATTPVVENKQVDVQKTPETPTEEKAFTKSQVIEMMKKRVERSHNSFFKRYGVENLQAMDELFDKAKNFQQMQDEYGAIQLKNVELTQQNAFLRNNINPEKYADILAYFKGKDIPFTEEAMVNEMVTHPEWLKVVEPTTTIKTLGSESHIVPKINDKDRASRLLGVKL